MKKKIVIMGAGGHAEVLLDTAQEISDIEVVALLDPDQTKWGKELFGVSILGGDEEIIQLKKKGIAYFINGVGSVRTSSHRKKVFEMGIQNGLQPFTLVHPSAFISKRAQVGEGTVVLAGAILNAGVYIGRNVIINTGAVIDHDCHVGDHVHVATGASLSGGVHIGCEAHIGTGASVKQGVR